MRRLHHVPLLLALLSGSLAAQVPLAGIISDSNPGPLASGVVYTATANLFIATGATLTVQPGAILKMSGGSLIVDGTLNVLGTEQSPAWFTSLHDDAIGGDSNGNGNTTVAAPGQWGGILARGGSSHLDFEHAQIRHHGAGGISGVTIAASSTTLSLRHTTLGTGSRYGLDTQGVRAFFTAEHCHFADNTLGAIGSLFLDQAQFLTFNTVSGNGGGNSLRIIATAPVIDTTLTPDNLVGGALILAGNTSLSFGRSITLQPGVVLKSDGTNLLLDGRFQALGTAENPVVLTSLADDVGGDSNGDGSATLPAPGQWGGVRQRHGNSEVTLQHVDVRYHGGSALSGFTLEGGNLATQTSITDSSFSHGARHGIELHQLLAAPVISNCRLENNALLPMSGMRVEHLPGLSGNTASGNGSGNTLRIQTGSAPALDVTVTTDNVFADGVLVYELTSSCSSGKRLTFTEGLIIKHQGFGLFSQGTLQVLGTAAKPVIFTSLQDDSAGGDSNADGAATTGAPGQWSGLNISETATANPLLRHVLVRYAGAGSTQGLFVNAASAVVERVRVEHAAGTGIRLSNATGGLKDLTVFDCAAGLHVLGTSTVRRVTVAGCSGPGIRTELLGTGSVRGAIAWGNTPDYSLVSGTAVSFSTGANLPAGPGNLAADPLFVDADAGMLRLQPGSPCIDAGDPGDVFVTGLDGSGFPRLIDGDLDGSRRVDMGAYEFSQLDLAVSGDFVPGGSLQLDLTGHSPLQETWMFVGTDVSEALLGKYGPIFVSLNAPALLLTWPAPPNVVAIDIPAALPVPLDLVLQAAGRTQRLPSAAGNVSNPVFVTIE